MNSWAGSCTRAPQSSPKLSASSWPRGTMCSPAGAADKFSLRLSKALLEPGAFSCSVLWDFWNSHLFTCPWVRAFLQIPFQQGLGSTLQTPKGNFSTERGIPRKKPALLPPCSPCCSAGRAGCLRDTQQPQGIGDQGSFPPSPSPGTSCSGLVISQLNISEGWSHHLVRFKVKLPEWDGRTDLFFLARLPPFSPAQQKKKKKFKKKIGRGNCACMWNICVLVQGSGCVFCRVPFSLALFVMFKP